MTEEILTGNELCLMLNEGAKILEKNAALVDALNVFPVPDGDTGKNMNLTFQSGVDELKKNAAQGTDQVAATFSHGLLLGARGNSGVILSQIFRGLSRGLNGLQVANGRQLAEAFQQGVDMAYKAVMKPVEGTILTVAKEGAKGALMEARRGGSPEKVMETLVREAQRALANTPNQLPVLKEVGVVDSGGQGLVFIFEGFLSAIKQGFVPTQVAATQDSPIISEEPVANMKVVHSHVHETDIQHGYCTEFMVHLKDKYSFDENQFKEKISPFGDSLLVVTGDQFIKVHIHAEKPGEVLSFAQQYGMLDRMKIDNMRLQHNEVLRKQEESQENGVVQPKENYVLVAVASGKGVTDIFRSLGVNRVIEGGQTMNPSTEDIVRAIEKVPANHVIILPNNKNIVMAAQQAAQLVSVPVTIIPSKTIPQGISAMLAFNPAESSEENEEAMKEAISYVKSGSITYSVRDTTINQMPIHKGDYIGMAEGDLVSSAPDSLHTSLQLLEHMVDEDTELITVIYGEDVGEGEVETLIQEIGLKFPDCEIETHNGGQPVYHYLFSVE